MLKVADSQIAHAYLLLTIAYHTTLSSTNQKERMALPIPRVSRQGSRVNSNVVYENEKVQIRQWACAV